MPARSGRFSPQIAPALGQGEEGVGRVVCAPPSVFALLRTYLTDEEADLLRRPLTSDNVTFQQVVLGRALDRTTTTTGKDKFSVPDTHLFLITEIRGHLLPVNLNADTSFSYGGQPQTNPEQIRCIRLQNCAVSLKNLSRCGELLIGVQGSEAAEVALSDLTPPYGRPVSTEQLQSLAIVRPKDTLEMEVKLKSTSANIENTSGANFGVLIAGILLRRKNG